MNMTPFVILGTAVAMVMGTHTEEDNASAPRYTVSSTHQAAGAPEQAAHCIAKNAAASVAPASQIQPLYGMSRVAVVMREHATADTIAVASLEPAEPGSNVRIDTMPYVESRDAFVSRILKGC